MTAIKHENLVTKTDYNAYDRCCNSCCHSEVVNIGDNIVLMQIIECDNEKSSHYKHMLSCYHYDCGHFEK